MPVDAIKPRKPKVDNEVSDLKKEVVRLEIQVENLKDAVAKFAVLSGHGNYLKEFGLTRWNPSQSDMNRKYSKG